MLSEQFRPQTWADVVGQESTVQRIQALAKRGLGGRAYWLSGLSGTGKTTIGRLIASEIAGPAATQEVNARGVSVEDVREMVERYRTTVLPNGPKMLTGRAWIFNEAHLFRKATCDELLTALEPDGGLPKHVVIVFTTTCDGQETLFEDYADAAPFLSRCLRLDLSRRDLVKPFAARLVTGARSEGFLNGKPDTYYLARAESLLKQERNNMRAAWQRVESGYLTDNDHDE
jgi:DNA polymerase-3 subunit gamma/tau